jgi:tight adherence protein B
MLRMPRVHRIDRLIEQAGSPWTVAQFLALAAAWAGVAVAVALLLSLPPVLTAAFGLAGLAVPWLYLVSQKRRRLAQIDGQMPDALDLMSRALRAGHALPSALQMVGDELAQPIAGEFRIAFDEVNYGISLKDAMMNLATRVPMKDLRYFVIAVLIQRETGGNLAELLDNIAALIRARHKLIGTIRVLSAEGRLSATILCVLPFVAGFLFYLANRALMSELWTDPIGVRLIAVAAVLMVVGIFWMRQIIRIRV